ncbi:hypothetical protein [Streptomyces alboverticillatus]|uniref:hypothetical protein n=1 Tax=Streptomyces alboverticillatus TaxID=173770 RepID=UPI000A378DD5|nr:hypothetical protein [Streptomyces alboverticillatus]
MREADALDLAGRPVAEEDVPVGAGVRPGARLVASESKTTYRPSALIEDDHDAPLARVPSEATLTSSIRPVRSSLT